MKKLYLLLSLVFLLTACSPKEISQDHRADAATEKQTEKKSNVYVPNPQVTDDRQLQKVGQTITDEKGEATLKAIKNVNQTYEMGPVRLTVKDVKIIHLIPDYSLIDYFHGLTHEEQFDFVKIGVEIKNASGDNVHFAPLAHLQTDKGEQKWYKEDIYLEDLNGLIEGQGQKQGNLGFILTEPNGDNVKSIKFITGDVVDEDKNVISKSQEISIEF